MNPQGKRRIISIATALLLFFLFFTFPIAPGRQDKAYAEGQEAIEEELEKEVKEGIDELIGEDFESFYQGLDEAQRSTFGSNVKEIINKIISGKQPLNIDAVFDLIFGATKERFFALGVGLISAIGLSILMGVAKNLNSGFSSEGSSKVVYFAVYAAILATMCIQLNFVVLTTKEMATNVRMLSEIIFPVLLTLMTALGASASAAVFQPVVPLVGTAVSVLVEGVVLPLFYAAVVFSVVGNLSDHVKLNKLSSAMNSIAKWVLGSAFGIVMSILSVQGAVGASVDGVTIRSARFALQSYVPILGGYLSDGFDVVMASCILLKNAIGLTGVILLLLVILSPTITLIVTSLGFKLTAGILEPIGDRKIASLYSSVAKSIDVLIAVTLGLGFLIFLSLFFIIRTCNMGGM